ncbi:MAG: DUF2306 domain-containing protein [Pseudomonadota bacterium]
MKKIAHLILVLLILFVAGSAIYNYGFKPLGWNLPPPMKFNYQTHWLGIYTHIFASVIALLLGPVQFWARLRQQQRQVHRWLGRVYLGVGVLLGGLSGLYMSLFSLASPAARLGFACLALCWLYTGVRAYQTIRAGDIVQHRAYMVRNFSLTLAAVSLRVYLPLSMMAGMDFGMAYTAIAWLCWIPNLVLAELIWNRSARPLALVPPGSANA